MNIEELREFCIIQKGVEESMPFGPEALVFKVMGKVFLISMIDERPLQFNVKCNPEKAIELRESYHCVKPGYHMNKKHWNTIIDNGEADENLLKQWIMDSYNLVAQGLTKQQKLKLQQS